MKIFKLFLIILFTCFALEVQADREVKIPIIFFNNTGTNYNAYQGLGANIKLFGTTIPRKNAHLQEIVLTEDTTKIFVLPHGTSAAYIPDSTDRERININDPYALVAISNKNVPRGDVELEQVNSAGRSAIIINNTTDRELLLTVEIPEEDTLRNEHSEGVERKSVILRYIVLSETVNIIARPDRILNKKDNLKYTTLQDLTCQLTLFAKEKKVVADSPLSELAPQHGFEKAQPPTFVVHSGTVGIAKVTGMPNAVIFTAEKDAVHNITAVTIAADVGDSYSAMKHDFKFPEPEKVK